ncbi:RAD protein [Plasmodium cynomolgi strain B]|uniref:RAD protein n=1 Tax=Plasmodium cynomolgi (strain B) TaxID=1120755 RepID=K6V7V1_PLACD|nr:RAD protein [Plasmodium cynomolgi strain B]GAB65207.1 RAD protein [Plasmodium cynomolgi strain B]
MHGSSQLFIVSFLALLSGFPQNNLDVPNGSHLLDLQSKGYSRNLAENSPILNSPDKGENGTTDGDKNAACANGDGEKNNASVNVGAPKSDVGPIANAQKETPGANGSTKAKMDDAKTNEEEKTAGASANGEKKDGESSGDGGSELPFGCTEEEMKQELTRNQLIDLTDSCGWFILDKKLVYLSLHHHKLHLTRTYYGMMHKLWGVLCDLALQHGMPEEEKKNLWEECSKELIQKLNDLLERSQKNSDSFLQKNIYGD